jgi:hypothetical protein
MNSRRSAQLASAVLALLAASGCTASERACTMIGSVSGVAITVDQTVAADVDRLSLRVCWQPDSARPTCQNTVVELTPGFDSVDQGCGPGGPDAVCSATAAPDGTQVGFVELGDLPSGPITVSGAATMAGQRRALAAVELTASPTYPNGPDCGVGGTQATVTLGSEGLR